MVMAVRKVGRGSGDDVTYIAFVFASFSAFVMKRHHLHTYSTSSILLCFCLKITVLDAVRPYSGLCS